MPDIIGRLNHGYHRLVDLFLRLDPSSAFNRARQPQPGGPGIAQELFASVQAMKAGASASTATTGR